MNKLITLTAALATITAFSVHAQEGTGSQSGESSDSTTDAGNPPSGESNDSTTDAGNPPSGSPETDTNANGASTGSTTTDGQTTTPGELADPAVNSPAEASTTPTTDGSMTMTAPEGFTVYSGSPILATSLQNANIYTSNGQVVGAVSQVVSGADGSASQIVFDVGQYMGADTKMVAVPVTDIQVYTSADNSEYRITLPMSEAEIQSLPAYGN